MSGRSPRTNRKRFLKSVRRYLTFCDEKIIINDVFDEFLMDRLKLRNSIVLMGGLLWRWDNSLFFCLLLLLIVFHMNFKTLYQIKRMN